MLGPTGSGKTPLGEALEKYGLFNRNCFHFDFGAQLRHAAECGGPGLLEGDISTIQSVLAGGALLEDDTFYIAQALLENFITVREPTASGLIVLNGLPRHTGQARDVGDALNVSLVVALKCSAETVHARIETNRGGDRAERTDDSIEEIARKLDIYSARTLPLLEYYSSAGVTDLTIPVEVYTTPEDILETLTHRFPERKI